MNPTSDLQARETPSNDREKETPDSKPTSQAIVALPLSFKLPNDNSIIASSSSEKKRRIAETPEGWICEARTRKNGIVDRFYYHQLTNVRCRSLKEVERYNLHGIRPGPKAREKEMAIIVATAEKKAKEREEIRLQGTETPGTDMAAGGGKNKGKSKIHIPRNINEHHQVLMKKILAEAWHNMTNPQDIRTEAWEEFEAMKKREAEEDAMETRLQEEREKLVRKFKEERQQLEKKFEEERTQLHKWMKNEIEYRIQLHWGAVMSSFLQGRDVTPPPPPPFGGDSSAGI
ncbi:hypothetical protein K1719_037554 [Acacia pycnantha]|nr:hypothetical protein K1719_037554 [Acacia pycnantha]